MSPSPHPKQSVTPAKAMLAAVSGYAMDGFDLLILGFMLPAISVSLALNPSQAGSLVTWTLIGAVIGGIVFGHLSDRFGRVRVLTITILVFSVFTGLCAVAQGYWDLLIYRTLAGVGLGGEFGIGMALIAEAWPEEKRNRASAWVGIGWQFGVLLAALITPPLLSLIGWRGMFLVGLLPAIVSFAIRRSMGEPEGYTQRVKHVPSLSFPARLRLLVRDRTTAKASLGIFIRKRLIQTVFYFCPRFLPWTLSRTWTLPWTKIRLTPEDHGSSQR